VLLDKLGVEIAVADDRWRFWVPALVRGPFGSEDDELVANTLSRLFEKAPAELMAATEQEMRGKPEFGQFTLRRISGALNSAAVGWLTNIIGDEAFDDATAGVAFEDLLRLDEPEALQLMASHLAQQEGTSNVWRGRARQMVVASLRAVASRAWRTSYAQLEMNDQLASDVIESLAHGRDFDTSGLTEQQVAELRGLTDRLFPAASDPVVRGAHAISARESIGHFRERLLPSLADRGTVEAVSVLRALVLSHPDDPSFRRIAARAEAVLRRSDWTPLTPTEILAVLASSRRVLRSDSDLLDTVLEALNQTQADLQGATPAATLLWDHALGRCSPTGGVTCRPKSEDEISDFLDLEIARLVPGSVVNREVQVRRLQTSGIGQRTDILIQVPVSTEGGRVLRVVIEVKGCWNDDIPDALECQLVSQYLNQWPGSAGVFLVAWFDPAHGSRPGSWRNDPVRGDKEALQQMLSLRAADATPSGDHVVVSLVLDCSMPR
jgi:hypothetical protein